MALFTACIAFCVLFNFLLFYKNKAAVKNALIVFGIIFFNQAVEFAVSFWKIDIPAINLLFIMTFNFALSFSVYFLLEKIQPGSKHNWKSFLFSVMLLPAGFVYLASFKMLSAGFFLASFRYFASPLASMVLILLQSFLGLFFLCKVLWDNSELRKIYYYRLLLSGYAIPPLLFCAVCIVFPGAVLYFESISGKLILLSGLSFLFFSIKTGK